MNCLVAVINGFVLFLTGMRITAFDFVPLQDGLCYELLGDWYHESLSTLHDKTCTVKQKRGLNPDH